MSDSDVKIYFIKISDTRRTFYLKIWMHKKRYSSRMNDTKMKEKETAFFKYFIYA